MNDAAPDAIFEFGEFLLDSRRRTVHRRSDGEPLDLTPRVFATLLHLVEHAGQLVDKRSLIAAVWPNTVVEESSLTQAIHTLRRGLGEHPDDHRFIVTVPGRGYRFVADVTSRLRPDVAAAGDPRAALLPARRSRRTWFAVGLAILLAALGTAAYYTTSAARRPGGQPANRSTAAYDDFQRGKFFYDRRGPGDLERALHYYERSVAQDPELALAWAGVAAIICIETAEGRMPRATGLPRLLQAANRTVALEPRMAAGHLRLACYYALLGQERFADEHWRRAVALEPANPLVLGFQAGRAAKQGRLGEAIELQRRAVAADPLSAVTLNNLGHMLYAAGRLDEAKMELLRANELSPRSGAEGTLGQILVLQRELDAALGFIERSTQGEDRQQGLALVYHALGRTAEADAALARLTALASTEDPFRIAEVYAYRGDADEAFRWLALASRPIDAEGMFLPGARNLWEMHASPLLTSLRGDPRWTAWVAGSS